MYNFKCLHGSILIFQNLIIVGAKEIKAEC